MSRRTACPPLGEAWAPPSATGPTTPRGVSAPSTLLHAARPPRGHLSGEEGGRAGLQSSPRHPGQPSPVWVSPLGPKWFCY